MINSLITTLDLYLVKKAPALPVNIKELLVKFSPWLSAIAVILSLPMLLAAFGLGTMLSTIPGYALATGFNYTLAIVFLGISVVMEALAVPGLFARSKSGWMMLFYAVLVNTAYQIIRGDLFGMIIGTLISLYLLFQVRSYYK